MSASGSGNEVGIFCGRRKTGAPAPSSWRRSTATAVCLGTVRTPMVDRQIAGQAKAHGISGQAVMERVLRTKHAVTRLVEPEEIAEVVVVLAGDGAGGITGRHVALDLAWTAH